MTWCVDATAEHNGDLASAARCDGRLSRQAHQQTLAAICLIDMWQGLAKKAKNSTSGARLTPFEKASKTLRGNKLH
eukprot:6075023-Amphidinium_carterae.2